MVEKVTGGKSLPAEVVQQIVTKTDGVPLFVEELTKSVLESGLLTAADDHYELTAPLPPLAIPSTLHDSLLARLDRLSDARQVAQLGATLGREFSYELLHAVTPLSEPELRAVLSKLVRAEILYPRGVGEQARYFFKHTLIQDAAYQSLLKSTRQQYHQQIASVLEAHFPQTKETQPELLAHHYTEAGLIPQAIPYWQQAGQSAAQRSAYKEAINHLTKGLELLMALPDIPERAQQELTLQIALGPPLMATKSWIAPEVERVYTRARELCRQVGETPQLFLVLYGLQEFYVMRAELQIAQELEAQIFSLAQRSQDPALLLEAYHLLGGSSLYIGELPAAHMHLEQAIALYNPQQHSSHTFVYSHDPGVCCLAFDAFALWLLGNPNQASKRMHQAQSLAQELAHPLDRALVLFYAAWLYQYRQEAQVGQELAEACITLCTEHGLPFSTLGTMLRGWALVEQGQGEKGVRQIRQGWAVRQAEGGGMWQPYYLALLAEACGNVGLVEEGQTVLTKALATVNKTGERFCEAELYRLKGELTLQSKGEAPQSTAAEAEACFLKAVEIAQSQQAKSWELRAATSLARLWRQQGKQKEAHQMLSDIYHWFTEGFDTKDLQEAKALLEELH